MAVDPDAVDAAGSDVVVRLNGITKRFPGVTANYAISLELRRGAVHCLLGENGSGKSTLIGIFAGLQQPDEGAIEIDGSPVVLRSPAAAIERGIGVVHQHSVLIPTMSAVENLLLGERGSLRLDRRGAESRLAELSETLGVPIDPNAPVGELGLGARQQLEIALALRSGSRCWCSTNRRHCSRRKRSRHCSDACGGSPRRATPCSSSRTSFRRRAGSPTP
ncbi:ATP-binding cassette domain-containing protein [Leucobacter soli]|uniref:ATP-binding cassette domain-containing protein n=1 Tax=Leucobacter soli TaxID=2812850 RepID=UPI00361D39EE